MKRALFTWSFVVLMLFSASGAGSTTHCLISYKAIDKVKIKELQKFLIKYQDIILSASNFPDYGYVLRELPCFGKKNIRLSKAHNARFIEVYQDYIMNNPGLKKRNKLTAHWLGSSAHSFQDPVYDEIFMKKAFLKDFGNYSVSYNMDIAADAASVMDPVAFRMLPHYYGPLKDLQQVYSDFGEKAGKGQLFVGKHLHRFVLFAERFVQPIQYYAFFKKEIPWTLKGIMDDSRGLDYLATLTARYWEYLWLSLNESRNKEAFLGSYPSDNGRMEADGWISLVLWRTGYKPENVKLLSLSGEEIPFRLKKSYSELVYTIYTEKDLEPDEQYTLYFEINGEKSSRSHTLNFTAGPLESLRPKG